MSISGHSDHWKQWWTPSILLLTVLISAPSLGTGFLMDDYLFFGHLDGGDVLQASWWNLYAIAPENAQHAAAMRAEGFLPWWSAGDVRIAFFRPLSSALLAAEARVFGDAAWLYHLDAILIYSGLVAAVGWLYRRALPAGVGALALLIFAVNDAHALAIGWLANRHAVLSMIPGVLAVGFHLRWREDGRRNAGIVTPLFLVLALLAGETGVTMLGYLVAYECLAGPGSGKERIRALLPTLAVALAYALLYSWGDFGAVGSGTYTDPVRETGATPPDS